MRGIGEESAKQLMVVLGIAVDKRMNFVEAKRRIEKERKKANDNLAKR